MNINWKNLTFNYSKTKYNTRAYFKNGKWSDIEISKSEYISLHMAATTLHYGQEAFEGLKAFYGKDKKIRIFRPDENAKRMQVSAKHSLMAVPPIELFLEAVKKAVKLNKEYIPPFGTDASLYIRPLLIGTSPQIGVKPAKEYVLIVMVMPVSSYFKGGFITNNVMITRKFDRAAPRGTGSYKLGGNYAAGLMSDSIAHAKGFSTTLYLDATHRKYIDECGPANFFAIKDNTYITPKSNSILPSIINKSLQKLAVDIGLKVERRRIDVNELNEFDEAGACGTAAVISPINKIYDADNDIEYVYGEKPGPISTKLYNKLRNIQLGEEEDIYGWNTFVK